jgi:hypothetical protein
MEKGTFFYTAIGVMLLINISLTASGSLLAYVPPAFMLIPRKKQWTATIPNRRQLALYFKAWLRGFAVLLNGLLVVTLGLLYAANEPEGWLDLSGWLYVLAVMALGWLLYFFPLFRNTSSLETVAA